MEITNTQYWNECKSLASNIVADAAYEIEQSGDDITDDTLSDMIYDTVLHETIDGHQWVIYYTYNLDVIRHSDNDDYMLDFGSESLEAAIQSGGLSGLHTAVAFWCLYADTQEYIQEAINTYMDEKETA